MTTVAELYNEDDHTINHHGFKRNVKEEDQRLGKKVGAHGYKSNNQVIYL